MLDQIYRYISLQTLIWCIVALPLSGAVLNGFVALLTARSGTVRFKSLVSLIGIMAPLLSLGAALVVFFTLTGFESTSPSAITGPLFKWVVSTNLVIDVGLKVDQLSLITLLTVLSISLLVHIYSTGFMFRDPGYARYFSEINLLLCFTLLVVLADNLVVMFIGWEGVSLCTYLLISFWFEDESAVKAGTKAFIINRIGDVGFLAAMFLIFGVMMAARALPESGLFTFETMERLGRYSDLIATIISLLIFVSVIGKSAQIPLYVWLPESVSAPMPALALIQSVSITLIGVYMMARLNFIFLYSHTALNIVAIVGAVGAIFAATMGFVSTDLKKILAYSTISQMGYMFMAIGVGAFSAAVFHLVTHAFFKATLFLCAGSVIHMLAGESDIRSMGGLKKRMPLTAWTFMIAAAALAGLVPTAGFFSQNAILWQVYDRGHTVLWAFAFLGEGLTAFYIFRAAGSVFFGETNIDSDRLKRVTESPLSMALPMMLLATFVLLMGALGVPEVLGGSNLISAWLGALLPYEIGHAPAVKSHAELILIVITLIWSLHFSILGLLIYAQRRDWTVKMAKRFGVVYKLVAHNYYIDEIYNWLIVKPVVWFSKRILWESVDKTLVDGLVVGGAARTTGFLALLAQSSQTGVLQRYLLYFLIGAAAIIGYLAL